MSEGPLRILQYFRCSPRYGASICIHSQCLELKRRGHEVSVIGGEPGSLARGIADEGFRLVPFAKHHKLSPAGLLRLRNLLVKEKPDILHTHLSSATLSGTIAARMARIPSVATVHGMNRRYTYSYADKVIAVSEAGKLDLVAQGLAENRVLVAHNGIPIPSLPTAEDKLAAKKKLGLPPDALVMGSVTRLAIGKGINDALDAFAGLRKDFPKLQLVLAGEGNCMQSLQEQARALQLEDQVHFLGYRGNVIEVLSAFDLFVLPSHSEGLPLCILEAMALEIPIVATDVGGIPEVVDSTCGILVPVKDPVALATACGTILGDSEKRVSMGIQARRRAEQSFSLEASCIAVENAYRSLLRDTLTLVAAGAAGTINAGEH